MTETTNHDPGPGGADGAADAAESEPVLDLELLQEVLEALPRDHAMPLLRAFKRTSGQLLNDMELAVARDDMAALSGASHALKGASGALGLVQLETCCAEIEKACGLETPAAAYENLAEIGPIVSSAHTEISAYLSTISPEDAASGPPEPALRGEGMSGPL